jgi:vancomycin resistance protein YoaR
MTPLRLTAAIAAVVVVGAALLLVVWQRSTPGVLTGVYINGEHVGGLARGDLPDVVSAATRDSLAEPVSVTSNRSSTTTTREGAGARADVDATLDEVWRRGRQRNPLAALLDHAVARLGRTVRIEPAEHVDADAVAQWAEQIAATMSRPPRDASVRFATGPRPPSGDEASRALVISPAGGEVVDADDLRARAVEALEAGGAVELDAPARNVAPAITQADLDAVLPDAQRAVSTTMRLANPSDAASMDLRPEDLARVLVTRADPAAAEGERLTVGVNPDRLARLLRGDRVAAIEGDPRDARFVVRGNRIRIRGGRSGYRFNAEAVAKRMEEFLADGRSGGTLPGDPVVPDFPRTKAEKLQITRRVSEFTTEHACCEGRVTNIQRMADLVDGVIIRPDDRFSLNDHVGRRTTDKGFVDGGVIVEGEFEEAVGGGVSQFSTTFLNAALNAGVKVRAFQPHSYYIDRYPMGHESTLNYGTIDVEVENDSPYGILVKTSYTDTSITVTFYSSRWAEVDIDVGPRRNVVSGELRDGFDVTWTRTITYPKGREEVEEYHHTYQPEDEPDED